VIHAINSGVYEINRGRVNANLLNLKENMGGAVSHHLGGAAGFG
jgi:hypothetical protein